jgi:hypothetical protein
MARHSRQSVSRSVIVPLQWSLLDYHLADVFPAVRVPTLVLPTSGRGTTIRNAASVSLTSVALAR